ncbi:MAG: hypothetical protein JST81_06375 [Bacteroidetes bacterium]|nr:hypothetical protein [Bacteroidota bacterium]
MKKTILFIIILVATLATGAWIYWQNNKKHIIKEALQDAVSDKTGNLYYIHYDSSSIDELNGNAAFYNVRLQSDSLQQQLAHFDSASAQTIFNISVEKLVIRGANIPALISNEKIEATSVRIIKPVIYIINSGDTTTDHRWRKEDSLALYEKILGRFKSIHAETIGIEDGELHFTYKLNDPFVSLRGINCIIKNVRIDSTRDYNTIAAYFIKDASASVKNVFIKGQKDNSVIRLNEFNYDAKQKTISLQHFIQQDRNTGNMRFNINTVEVTGLSTDAFILENRINAKELTVRKGLCRLYMKKAADRSAEIDLDSSFLNGAHLQKISLNDLRIELFSANTPNDLPLVFTAVNFNASDIPGVTNGSNVKNILANSNWELLCGSFKHVTKDRNYNLSLSDFRINKAKHLISIGKFMVSPALPQQLFVQRLKEQKDMYDIVIDNIELNGVETEKIIIANRLVARAGTIRPVIKVFCDRTIPAFTGSKLGNYPHQLIQKLQLPVYIQQLDIHNGYVSYTEKASQSEKKGTVYFSNITGSIQNLTNIPSYVNANTMMQVKGKALFMGVSRVETSWQLPLNTTNGEFSISGKMGELDCSVLNPLIEPLAMASFSRGKIQTVDFTINGNDNHATGKLDLLYSELKLETLKADADSLKKKKMLSFLANLLVKDENPHKGKTRQGEIDIDRDTSRSFFNLVWKGIFKAAKRIAIGKDDD